MLAWSGVSSLAGDTIPSPSFLGREPREEEKGMTDSSFLFYAISFRRTEVVYFSSPFVVLSPRGSLSQREG